MNQWAQAVVCLLVLSCNEGFQPLNQRKWRKDQSFFMNLSLGEQVRKDFPLLTQESYDGKPLIYLDNAATSQKPTSVISGLEEYYKTYNSNVHRGAHILSMKSTEAYESARDKVKVFVNAKRREEIVFTRGATEAINLVAYSWGDENINSGDEIILTVMEHHSNMVPWQLLAKRKQAKLRFVTLDEDMNFDMEKYLSLLGPRTKLVACVHASNMLGCINPIKDIAREAHKVGARVLVDACQSVPNMIVDVQDLDPDWLVASGHKMCGPTGIGFLYGKYDVLDSMSPWQGGGEMIDEVFYEYSTFAAPPSRFEAGTPAIAQAIGLGYAVDYLTSIGMENIQNYEHELSRYLYKSITQVPNLVFYGPPCNERGDNRNPLIAFNSKTVHAHDLSFFIDQEGVAIRAGHHCTQALHRSLGAAGSLRASCYFYNTKEDIDGFMKALESSVELLDPNSRRQVAENAFR